MEVPRDIDVNGEFFVEPDLGWDVGQYGPLLRHERRVQVFNPEFTVGAGSDKANVRTSDS